MKKSRTGVATSNAEIDAAIAHAKLYDEYRPKAVSAKYLRTTDSVKITLATGVEIVIPRKLLQGLDHATPAQLADVRVVAAKSGLYWKLLDVDHYLPSL